VRRDDELDKELRFHIETRVDDLVASGITLDEARRQARLELGGITQTKEAIADQNSWRFLDGSLSDLRLAIRSLRRTPIFTLRRSLAPNRFNMRMLAMFSGLALTLAGIGVYGLTTYAVAQRTRELGIRVSLGRALANWCEDCC